VVAETPGFLLGRSFAKPAIDPGGKNFLNHVFGISPGKSQGCTLSVNRHFDLFAYKHIFFLPQRTQSKIS
jgi:hypothetical protein